MKKQNQTIFITGASSGIGKDIVIRLAKEGFKVFAGVRKKVDKIELESISKNITPVYIDVTNQSSIDKAFWFVMKNTNHIDVLINNAGIVCAGPVECIPTQKIKEQFDVNTFGPVMVVQKFMPLLSKSKVINISSMASSGIFPYISMYCASKRALDIIFNCFELENKDRIKVISVKPASIKTPIWNKSVLRARECYSDVSESLALKYSKELTALEKNAISNTTSGINVKKVTDVVLKIIKSSNPKTSYNVGFSAVVAEFVSKLPSSLINALIRFKLNRL